VVVDNGSEDDTLNAVASFVRRLPMQSVFVPVPGKNHALNAGLAHVEGDVVVFTDDDVFPRPDWLVELRRAADSQRAVTMFGGVVVPRWEVPPPPWVNWLDCGPIFTVTPSWLREGELPEEHVPLIFGPNMGVRTAVFAGGARFDTSIGPSGRRYPMGSETELVLRLARNGHKGWHAERAIVEHFIRKDQLTPGWILGRAVCFGRGQYRLFPNSRLWGGIPRHLFRDIPVEWARIALAALLLRDRELLQARWRCNVLLGRGLEAWSMVRSGHGSTPP
jgi:glycosyltransferase involved in cell wall biosynthesis